VIALLLLGCRQTTSDAKQAITLPHAADQTILASTEALGAYKLDATVVRTFTPAQGDPRRTEEGLSVRWKDPDHWSQELLRDGKTRQRILVWDAVAWTSTGDGAPEKRGDAEPWRVQLSQTWDPWGLLEGLREQVALTKDGVDVIEGRRAERHTLSVAPLPPKARRAWQVSAVDGTVWIDEATAVRLKGHAHVVADGRREKMDVVLDFAFGGIGQDPGIVPPSP
jgi:hypothetical protein